MPNLSSSRSWRSIFAMWVGVFAIQGAFAMEVSPSDPIQLQISADPSMDSRGLSYLAVELDGYDASAFVTELGTHITLQLPSPLDSGSHDLRVTAFYGNGDIETLLQEPLVVSGSGAGHWSHAIGVNNSYRSIGHEKPDFAEQSHFSSDGAVVLRGEHQRGRTGLKLEVESLYDSNPSNNPSGNEFDLSYYLMEAAYQGEEHNAFVRVGDDQLQQDNLLFSAYQRRGVAAGMQGQDQSYSLHTFAFQSDPTTSPDNQLGYPESRQERSTGAVFGWSPLADKQELVVSVGYVEGEGTSGGTGFQSLDESTTYGGNSWNLAVDSRLMEGALLLHAEYAGSDFDADGIGSGNSHVQDNAWSALVEYAPGYDGNGLFDQWSVGAKVQEVDAGFWSIGNLGLAGDLFTETLYYQGGRGGFGFAAELTRESNNVDADPAVADQQSRLASLYLYYSPMDLDSESPVWRVLGIPSFSGYISQARRTQSRSDALLSGYDLNDLVREYSVAAIFSKDQWSWSLQHNQTWLDDRSDLLVQNGFTIYEPPSDSVNLLTTLMLSYMPTARMTVSPMVQWSTLKEDETDNQSDTINLGIDGQLELIPNKWFFNLNYSLGENDNRYEDGIGVDVRQRDQVLNLQSTWRLHPAKGISPGIDLYLKGSYGRQQEREVDTGEEIYQVLLGFTLYWNKEGN